jgi:nicotinamidase-related amidase
MHKIDIPHWAIERGRNMNDFPTIDPARTAVVAIDMQNVFMELDEVFGNQNALDIVPAVNQAVRTLRDAGGTVIWTRQTVSDAPALALPPWQYDMSIPTVRRAVETMTAGTRSHAVHDAMDVRNDDIVIDKYRYGAFICPAGNLKAALDALPTIDTLVIAGTLTNCCCDSTARDGNMLGYKIVFLSDATATRTDEEHNAALLNIRLSFGDVRRTSELPAMIAGATAIAKVA